VETDTLGRTKHLDQLESKNILVLREILSFRGDYSRSAFPNGYNLTNESKTLVTISERKKRHQFESNPLVFRLLFSRCRASSGTPIPRGWKETSSYKVYGKAGVLLTAVDIPTSGKRPFVKKSSTPNLALKKISIPSKFLYIKFK